MFMPEAGFYRILKDINERLESMDDALHRIAEALEALVLKDERLK